MYSKLLTKKCNSKYGDKDACKRFGKHLGAEGLTERGNEQSLVAHGEVSWPVQREFAVRVNRNTIRSFQIEVGRGRIPGEGCVNGHS